MEKFQQVAYSKVIVYNSFIKFTFIDVTICNAKLISIFTYWVPIPKKTQHKSHIKMIRLM